MKQNSNIVVKIQNQTLSPHHVDSTKIKKKLLIKFYSLEILIETKKRFKRFGRKF